MNLIRKVFHEGVEGIDDRIHEESSKSWPRSLDQE